MFEIAEDFEAVYKQKPAMHRLGSLDDLFSTMHNIRAAKPHNMWSWLPLFYTYYSINGQTSLPLPLDNNRYPDVKLQTVRDYFASKPLKRLGTW